MACNYISICELSQNTTERAVEVKLEINQAPRLELESKKSIDYNPTASFYTNGLLVSLKITSEKINPFMCDLSARFQSNVDDTKFYRTTFSFLKPTASRMPATHFIHCSTEGRYNCRKWRSITSYQLAMPKRVNLFLTVECYRHSPDSLVNLHADEQYLDYSLHAKDGIVRVHRAILAASSEEFKDIMKTKNHYIDVQYPVSILKQVKQYIYLGVIPKSDLEDLILFSRIYQMKQLELDCIGQLVSEDLTPEKAKELIQFAFENDIDMLRDAVMLWYVQGERGLVP